MAKKYIDAEKLIDIIEKLESIFKKLEKTIGREDFFKGKREMAVQTRSIIKSLQQEQPEVDLEKEIITQWSKCNPTDEGMGSEYAIIGVEQFDAIVRYFYELGFKAKEEQI